MFKSVNDCNIGSQFSQSFYARVGEDLAPSLQQFEEISMSLAQRSRQEIVWKPPEDPNKLLDHYLEFLSIVYFKKYSLFCEYLIRVLNEENYLFYGLIGRAIIEHTAQLHYYVTSKMLPLAKEIVSDGNVTESEVKELIQWLEKHLTGSRFDWETFMADYFQNVNGEAANQELGISQVNILTCLKKLGQKNPSIIPLYELFCDLVHPNLGSTLLIAQLLDNHFVLGSEDGTAIGLEIVSRTFEQLLELFQEVKEQLIQLQSLRFEELLASCEKI